MSKIKQHLESEIVISHFNEESTGFKRYIAFNYEGNEYELTLFWDSFDGYEIYWQVPRVTPDWIVNWDEEAHNGNSFEAYLDELTWEEKR